MQNNDPALMIQVNHNNIWMFCYHALHTDYTSSSAASGGGGRMAEMEQEEGADIKQDSHFLKALYLV